MRLLIMDGDTVANVIEVDPTAIPPEFSSAPVAPEGVGVGMVWDGTDYINPTPDPAERLAAERAAMSATRGQFLIAAVGAGIITEATAEEAAGGGWPAAFDTFLAGLTTQQRIAAKAAWVDGDRVRRNNPILALIAADQGVTEVEIDDLFRAAMQIEP